MAKYFPHLHVCPSPITSHWRKTSWLLFILVFEICWKVLNALVISMSFLCFIWVLRVPYPCYLSEVHHLNLSGKVLQSIGEHEYELRGLCKDGKKVILWLIEFFFSRYSNLLKVVHILSVWHELKLIIAWGQASFSMGWFDVTHFVQFYLVFLVWFES